MRPEIQKSFLFRLLTSPELTLRISRHGLLWTTALLLNFEGFYFLTSSIADASNYSDWWYSTLACAVFGIYIMGAYWTITTLVRQFILINFKPVLFLSGLILAHLVASELVFLHFKLFIHFITLPRLPRFYANYADHFGQLPFWKAPFDTIIVFFFSLSFFYNYVLYVVGFKVFKDLFAIQLQQIDLKRENLRLELDFLKAQINPHFLFNTLNNIYSFSIRSPEKVEVSLLKLSDLMRYTLYETREEQVPLRNELTFLTSYLDLQRIRHDDNVTIQFQVNGVPTTQFVPPLLLITFVENAFKHGIQASAFSSWVSIRISLEADQLTMHVNNSVPRTRQTSPVGIGLVNVRKRLEYLFPNQHTLTISTNPDQFQVQLTLNLHESSLPRYYS